MKNADSSPELYELSRPIPAHLIHPPAPGKYGDYVPHYVIGQVLLATLGPYDWELVEILRGSSSGKVKGAQVDVENAVVGAVYRLSVTIDGRPTIIEEIGEVDAYKEPTDGARSHGLELGTQVTEVAGLLRAAPRHGLGVEEQDHRTVREHG